MQRYSSILEVEFKTQYFFSIETHTRVKHSFFNYVFDNHSCHSIPTFYYSAEQTMQMHKSLSNYIEKYNAWLASLTTPPSKQKTFNISAKSPTRVPDRVEKKSPSTVYISRIRSSFRKRPCTRHKVYVEKSVKGSQGPDASRNCFQISTEGGTNANSSKQVAGIPIVRISGETRMIQQGHRWRRGFPLVSSISLSSIGQKGKLYSRR